MIKESRNLRENEEPCTGAFRGKNEQGEIIQLYNNLKT